jgi:hypothetical protein
MLQKQPDGHGKESLSLEDPETALFIGCILQQMWLSTQRTTASLSADEEIVECPSGYVDTAANRAETGSSKISLVTDW